MQDISYATHQLFLSRRAPTLLVWDASLEVGGVAEQISPWLHSLQVIIVAVATFVFVFVFVFVATATAAAAAAAAAVVVVVRISFVGIRSRGESAAGGNSH